MWSHIAAWAALGLALYALCRAEHAGIRVRRLADECEDMNTTVDDLVNDSTTAMLRTAGVDVAKLRDMPLPCPYCCSPLWHKRQFLTGRQRWVHREANGGRVEQCADQRRIPHLG